MITRNIIIHRHILAAFVLALLLPATAMAEGGTDQEQTLYDRLGGLAPISVVVSDFIDTLLPDAILNENPEVDAARERVPAPYLKYHVTAMVCQVTGGPCEYHGRGMKQAHAHLNITERQWDRMVTLFKGVLARHEVPERETRELLEIIGSTKPDIVVAGQGQ